MTLLLLFGIIGLLVILMNKKTIVVKMNQNNMLVLKLTNTKYFQNPLLAGVLLFLINGFLFMLTILVLYTLIQFLIPFLHLFVMLLAVCGSIYVWLSINIAWQGTKSNRIKMGFIGSSFFAFMMCIFIYWFIRLEPSYPDEDMFMEAVGLVIAITITAVAFITSFFITGFADFKNELDK